MTSGTAVRQRVRWGAAAAAIIMAVSLLASAPASAASSPAWDARDAAHRAGLAAVADMNLSVTRELSRGVGDFKVPARTWYAAAVVTATRVAFPGEVGSTEYVIAAREALLARGFTRDSSLAGGHGASSRNMRSNFVSPTLVCQIQRTFATQSSLAQVWVRCLDRASLSKIVSTYSPFVALIAKQNPLRLEGALLGTPIIGTGVSGYLNGRIHSWSAHYKGNASFYFAKAPSKAWVYVTGTTGNVTCAALEATTTSRRAFAGDLCIRGGGLSNVRG